MDKQTNSIQNSDEYKKLLNKLKAVEIERNEIEQINKKLLDDLKVYYEERIRILELNYSSKALWSNFESEITKNYEDKSVGCNLLSEMNLNDLINVTDSKKFLKNLNRLIKNELKKIKSEILEINLKRSDLMNIFDNFNSYLTKESTNQKNKGMISRFKNLDKHSIKIKNDHLDALYEKFDSQIVELSNVFLNEKLDLIFKHNQIVDEINQKLIESKSPNEFSFKDSQTQTSNDLSSFFKQLEKIGQSEKFKTQEIQTDINHLANDEFLKLNSIFDEDKINSDKYSLEFDQLNFEDLLSLLSINSVDHDKTEQIKETINYKLNYLKRQNESLNNINGELKLIICRMYDKLNDF